MTNNGGPAFPFTAVDAYGSYHCAPGMTLRDWFACQALAALVAYPDNRFSADTFAESSYLLADAMLRQRER